MNADSNRLDDGRVWPVVAGGLRAYFVILLVKVGLAVAFGLAVLLMMNNLSYDTLDTFLTVSRVAFVVMTLIEVFGIEAVRRMASSPESSGARGRFLATAILMMLVVVIDIIGSAPLFSGDFEALEGTSPWDIVSRILSFVALFTLLSALQSLAQHFGRADLAEKASKAMGLVGILVFVLLFGGLVLGAMLGKIGAALVVIASLGLGVWAFVLLLIVLRQLAHAAANEGKVASAFS